MILQRLSELDNVIKKAVYTKNKQMLDMLKAFDVFALMLQQIILQKGKVFVIGNGGSAGIASHFANDLLKSLNVQALTLVDSNILTCMANDYGYEYVYSHQLKVLMNEEDMLIAISSSGKSSNIINAVQVASDKKALVITLSGFLQNNPLRQLGDLNIWLNSQDYGLVETGHFFILHTIVDLWKTDYFVQSKKSEKTLCEIR